jgi:hypothetical protein
MGISLGRDCSILFGGIAVPGVRDVSVDLQPTTIQVDAFGTRAGASYSTGYSYALTVDTIDDAAAITAAGFAVSGETIAVSATGLPSGLVFIVTGVSDGQPLDGVRAFSISLAQSIGGLR